MSDSVDITKPQSLPPQEPPPRESPVKAFENRTDPPRSESRSSQAIPSQPSSGFTFTATTFQLSFSEQQVPKVRADDSVIAQALTRPVSGSSQQVTLNDVASFAAGAINDVLRNMTVNGFSVGFQNNNLTIPVEAFLSEITKPSNIVTQPITNIATANLTTPTPQTPPALPPLPSPSSPPLVQVSQFAPPPLPSSDLPASESPPATTAPRLTNEQSRRVREFERMSDADQDRIINQAAEAGLSVEQYVSLSNFERYKARVYPQTRPSSNEAAPEGNLGANDEGADADARRVPTDQARGPLDDPSSRARRIREYSKMSDADQDKIAAEAAEAGLSVEQYVPLSDMDRYKARNGEAVTTKIRPPVDPVPTGAVGTGTAQVDDFGTAGKIAVAETESGEPARRIREYNRMSEADQDKIAAEAAEAGMSVEQYVPLSDMDRYKARNGELSSQEEPSESTGSSNDKSATPSDFRDMATKIVEGRDTEKDADSEHSGGGTRQMGEAFGAAANRRPGETKREQEEREREEVRERNGRGSRGSRDDDPRPDSRLGAAGMLAAQQAARMGDTTLYGKSYIPVLLTRADNAKDVVVYVDNTYSEVVRGGVPNVDRIGSLPSPVNYYQSGGGGCTTGLSLRTKSNGDNGRPEVWVGPGTIDGKVPPGVNASEGKLIATSGSGYVWAKANFDQSQGTVTSVAVESGGSPPSSSTTTSGYLVLGYYQFTGSGETLQAKVSNYVCGSVAVSVCRNWFTNNPPFYTFSLSVA